MVRVTIRNLKGLTKGPRPYIINVDGKAASNAKTMREARSEQLRIRKKYSQIVYF